MTDAASDAAHRRTVQMLTDPELGGDLLLVGLALVGLVLVGLFDFGVRPSATRSTNGMWPSWRARERVARSTRCGACWPAMRAPTAP